MSEPLNEEEAIKASKGLIRTGKLCGLIDHGTNDTLNVTLQVLYNIPEFRIALYQSIACDTVPMVKCLVNIFARMQLSSESNRKPPSPIGVFEILEEYLSSDTIRQASSDELYAYILENLRILTPSEDPLHQVIEEKFFNGSIRSTLKCRGCGGERARSETVYQLRLGIKDKTHLKGCFEAFEEKRPVEGYRCGTCETRQDADSFEKVEQLASIMMISLERFSLNYETLQYDKMPDLVSFPSKLTLSPDQEKEYELTAILSRYGSAGSGCNFAILKNPEDDQWYEICDTEG
jgi:uncharacterized UBP type Zn finger protein